MPDPTISAALREAYAVAPADEVIIHTLELRHPTFVGNDGLADSVWITTNESDIEATLEIGTPVRPGQTVNFIALAFRFRLAPIDATGRPELQLEVDNVSRILIRQLDRAAGDPRKVTATYRPFLASDLSAPQMDPPPTFTLSKIKVNALAATATARVDIDFNGAFPRRLYTAAEFPALIGA